MAGRDRGRNPPWLLQRTTCERVGRPGAYDRNP
jgi:hypothetical protein